MVFAKGKEGKTNFNPHPLQVFQSVLIKAEDVSELRMTTTPVGSEMRKVFDGFGASILWSSEDTEWESPHPKYSVSYFSLQ